MLQQSKYYAIRLGHWVEIRSSAKIPRQKRSTARFSGKTFTTVIYEGGKVQAILPYRRFANSASGRSLALDAVMELSVNVAKRMIKRGRRNVGQ